MIKVNIQPEPATFNAKVRLPGERFLRACGGRPRKWKKKEFWRETLNDLRISYGGICAYSSFWIPQGGSVDHFWPKSQRPDLAYEWSNYRFCNPKINSNKGDSQEVLDPFNIINGWFTLNFASFLVEPGENLPEDVEKAINDTIRILQLNKDDVLIQSRYEVARSYAMEEVTLPHLQRRYPFIAAEILRQGVTESIKTLKW
jgi:hypothetical protein